MQIPSEYLYALGGAAVALFGAWFRGWLRLPFLDGVQAPQQQPSPQLFYHTWPPVGKDPTDGQSYSAVIEIPHKITVTPQQGSK